MRTARCGSSAADAMPVRSSGGGRSFEPATSWNGLDAIHNLAISGYRYVGNTGVPAGAILAYSGTVVTTADNQVVQNLNITGHVDVQHDGVTVKNCRLISDTF